MNTFLYRVPENRNKQEINVDIKMCLYCNWKKVNGLHHHLQKSLRLDIIHIILSLSIGLDLEVTIFYTCLNALNAELNPFCHLLTLLGAHHILHVSKERVNITICLAFAEIGHSTVYYVQGHISLFSETIGRKRKSSSSQNVIKDKCGHFILNITTLYETCLNLIQIQLQPILISVFVI